jgi:hypothetical protein
MDRKKQEEEQLVNQSRYKKSSKQKDTRGGDSEDDGEKNHWDHEMIFKYVKLQVKVRLRQLGYGTPCYSSEMTICLFFF